MSASHLDPEAPVITNAKKVADSILATDTSIGAVTTDQSSATVGPSLNASLVKLKLLDCIRNDDSEKLSLLLEDISDSKDKQLRRLRKELLHYAVQVGPLSIIRRIVDSKLVHSVNYQDKDGNTPLHLAVMSARNDVIDYLMSLSSINDTILNEELKQPIECTSSMEIVQLMSDLRTRYVEKEAARLRRGFQSRDFSLLESVLSVARARELLDINGTDPVTGDTVLLEFIKKDDVDLVKFILKHGGDPFKRSVSGRLPVDCTTSSSMRRVIKTACNDQSVIDSNSDHPAVGPPTFKGFLKKWTNFAGGYKLRWFVLAADGTLSYYKSPNEMDNACRGMIHLAKAQVRMDSSEKCKFELIIANLTGGSVKWHLKANHQIESNRWVWNLQNAIKYARDEQKASRKVNQVAYRKQKNGKLTSVQEARKPQSSHHNAFSSTDDSTVAHGGLKRSSSESRISALASNPITRSTTSIAYGEHRTQPAQPQEEPQSLHSRSLSRDSASSSTSSHNSVASTVARGAKNLYKKPIHKFNKLAHRSRDQLPQSSIQSEDSYYLNSEDSTVGTTSREDEEDDDDDDDDDDDGDDVYMEMILGKRRPDNSKLTIIRNQIRMELKSFSEFLDHFKTDSNISNEDVVTVSSRILKNLSQLYEKEEDVIQEKEFRLEKLFDRQTEISNIWESSIRQLELEIQDRESKICDLEDTIRLVRRSLRASVIIPAVSSPDIVATEPSSLSQKEAVTTKRDRSSISSYREDPQLAKFLEQEDESEDEFFDAAEEEEEEKESKHVEEEILGTPEKEEAKQLGNIIAEKERRKSEEAAEKSTQEVSSQEATSDNEEEIEEIVRKVKPTSGPFQPILVDGRFFVDNYPIESEAQKARYVKILDDATFKGYEDPIRTTLAREDNRPKISLWSVLKSLIGKDMTKMTLPVAFNEPTSLLQRNIEIMEYSDLLDKAASIEFSPLRMVYVAGFAASEYASTVGRIAKPFNPLLGETYEYARPDKGYRVFCEQVSHHPPISAVVSESPYWAYYGESNVKTKFYGRSFDIRHLGTWFCELYPSTLPIDKRTGKQTAMELYSWKKVNNSVVGIIIGRPTIDNYGEMEIKNHMTGDYMHLHFKERGWRSSNAYEVKGEVYSADKTLQYQIAGHWNTKIYAKSATDPSLQKFVVFSAKKRQDMLFHLTNFAAGLNAPQPHLLPVVACTDTRLRPDQRAMENAEYDLASEEKNRVEEKQRAHKKEMEEKNIVYKPSFFVKDKHPVTGEDYWRFTGTYWKDRKDGKLKDYKDIF
ncbi:hypothetical protein FOA43_000231 [Brettanomyces nanus]|uniref:PH domain-containing protein n=1 Tax=Eeniella nana TaxID=13502 RepID=A0A875RSW5_EENNA|nr:uncharacterized protein FOA43_000231 [Brettanomyces nanus]QPG72927.1 hypothetical protein FOA43_000231 [Brettanomyces nanus]